MKLSWKRKLKFWANWNEKLVPNHFFEKQSVKKLWDDSSADAGSLGGHFVRDGLQTLQLCRTQTG